MNMEEQRDFWRDECNTYTTMVREAVENIFGPLADLESREGTLTVRGPERRHDAEAIVDALHRVNDHLLRYRAALSTISDGHLTRREAARIARRGLTDE